jgi:hypothetical protein
MGEWIKRLAAFTVLGAALACSALAQSSKKGAPPAKPPAPAKSALERMSTMTPEQRRRVLDKLPPERQKVVMDRLENYQKLPPAERQRLNDQYQLFRQLPPERQDEMRRLFRKFNNLPEDRKAAMQQEFQNIRGLPEAERRARLRSEEFRMKYTVPERRLLSEMADVAADAPK